MRKAHARHFHVMGKPWQTSNGHTLASCTVAGCDYVERDGAKAGGRGAASPDAQQGALFDVWGVGVVPSLQEQQ